MSKRRKYFFDDSLENQSSNVEEAEEKILEDAINKMEKVKEDYTPKEPRIPTMLNDPDRLEKGKRRVKSIRLRLRKEPSRVAEVVSFLEKDTILTVDISYKNNEWDRVIDENGNEKGYVMKIYITPYI